MSSITRESWLINATTILRGWFAEAGYPLSESIRLSVGFPSKSALSRKAKRVGECWSSTKSSDGFFHVFISPLLGDPVEVLAVLVHELVHVAVGTEAAHKGPFVKGMKALGMEAKFTESNAGEALKAKLVLLLEEIGPYPHGPLSASEVEGKKQTTRLLKAVCPNGDASGEKVYTVRITKVHLDSFGAPICPKCLSRMVGEDGESFPGSDDDSDNETEFDG
jgi:hypothetical protein